MNDYKNVFIFSFSLLIYVNSNNQRVILNVLLVHTWQSARIIDYRNPQVTFYTPCMSGPSDQRMMSIIKRCTINAIQNTVV